MSKTEQITKVHAVAARLSYDLDLPDNVRHPPRFFVVSEILRASQLPVVSTAASPESVRAVNTHQAACDCRFCTTVVLKRPV